jgi:hypothetical protein
MKTYWASGGIAPRVLDLGTKWRSAVSFTPWPLYPQGKSPGNIWIGGWVGSRAVLDTVVKRKIPSPRRKSNPKPRLSVQPVAWLHSITTRHEWINQICRSQWQIGLRWVRFWTAWKLGSCVRIPLEAWNCVCFFLCCASLCRQRPSDGPIPFKVNLPKYIKWFTASEVNSETEQARGPKP